VEKQGPAVDRRRFSVDAVVDPGIGREIFEKGLARCGARHVEISHRFPQGDGGSIGSEDSTRWGNPLESRQVMGLAGAEEHDRFGTVHHHCSIS
jgi:hypothetical protein